MLLPPTLDELIEANHPVRIVDQVIDNVDDGVLVKQHKGGMNSFSKTDPDAIVMRMKEDYMKMTSSIQGITFRFPQTINLSYPIVCIIIPMTPTLLKAI